MRWLIFFGVFISLHAQNKQLLYGFTEVPQQILLNPGAQVDYRGYIGVPLLSHIHFSAGITGFSAFDVFADDGKDFNQKIRDVVYEMNARDFVGFNQQLDVFSAGLTLKTSTQHKLLISFGLYQESDVFSYFPKDFAVLAYEGNYNNLNRRFDFGQLNVSAELLSVFHIGVNKKINSKWTLGLRGKVYSSIVQASSTQNKGSFITVPTANNNLNHVFDLDMKLQTSGLSFLDDSSANNSLDVLKKRLLFGGNLGLGVDVGFTHQPSPEWTIDASLQDLGFINYSKDELNSARKKAENARARMAKYRSQNNIIDPEKQSSRMGAYHPAFDQLQRPEFSHVGQTRGLDATSGDSLNLIPQARNQVELAQYQYILPRLKGLWTHLERQKGGIGMRGPGETEIETDRRIIREKITLLKKKLLTIDKQMAVQRKNRGKMVRVALVGYTNVGKSTLMNVISKSDVFAENKLFATLDTTVRKVVIKNIPFLLTDTVGFIRKLPTQLVESFKSTLDEVREADLLLHIVDISHPNFEDHIASVNSILNDIKCADKPSLLVFNKIDAYAHETIEEDDIVTEKEKKHFTLQDWKKTWMNDYDVASIFISALNKKNLENFKEKTYEEVKKIHTQRFPYNDFLYYEYKGEDA